MDVFRAFIAGKQQQPLAAAVESKHHPTISIMQLAEAALTVFAWPIVLHLLFVTARKYDDLLQNLLLRLLLYVGSSVVLVRLPAAPDVRSMKLALARVLTPMIEPFVPESWIATKLAGFFAGALWRQEASFY